MQEKQAETAVDEGDEIDADGGEEKDQDVNGALALFAGVCLFVFYAYF